jgi:hypothetical protein
LADDDGEGRLELREFMRAARAMDLEQSEIELKKLFDFALLSQDESGCKELCRRLGYKHFVSSIAPLVHAHACQVEEDDVEGGRDSMNSRKDMTWAPLGAADAAVAAARKAARKAVAKSHQDDGENKIYFPERAQAAESSAESNKRLVELEHEVAEMKRKVENEESVTASAVAAAASAAEAAANEASRTHGTPTPFGLKLKASYTALSFRPHTQPASAPFACS